MNAGTPRRRRARFDDPDRTARARIRDAAIERFASEGIAAANLKDIAADAGVSTPLVIHHFGSKEGLRAACDEYVAAVIREQKSVGMAAGQAGPGGGMDPLQAVREAYEGTPIIRYLATTIADGSAHVDGLVDDMIEDAVAYLAEGVENGILEPAENPRERAIILSIWQMGALAMHRHVKRLLGIDLIDDTAGSALEWARLNTEILAKGVVVEEVYDKWRDAMRAAAGQSSTGRKGARGRKGGKRADQEST